MTMQTGMSAFFAVGAPPQGGDFTGLLRWCSRLFVFLQQFLAGPEFNGVTLTRIDAPPPADFKAQDGMLIYAGPGALGASAGLYLRDGGSWKLISAT
jgi:hypothetical protein